MNHYDNVLHNLNAALAGQAEKGFIPLVDLRANYLGIKAEIDEGIAGVLSSCFFVGGPEVGRFEKAFAAWCQTDDCIGVNSGTDALFLAAKFLGIGPGCEIIAPANTFIATVLGASNLGADVVLVDCTPDGYLMDVSKVEALITEKTRAIVPVHLYGQYVDIDPLLSLSLFALNSDSLSLPSTIGALTWTRCWTSHRGITCSS